MSETSAMSEGLSSNGSVADIKADMKSEINMKRQPNVSQNVSRETFTKQEIQLLADMTDMADIKTAKNSSNTGKKADEIALRKPPRAFHPADVDRPLQRKYRPLTEPIQEKDLSVSVDDVDD